MRRPMRAEGGFTLVELLITVILLGTVATAMLTLFVSLVHSAVVAKREAVASTLATNQMEYLKSLPYNSLAIAGGSIYSANPLPASTTKTLNGVKYTVTSSVSYVDDAFDGCGSYPTQALKQVYCRNYPPPSGAPTDTNPADYKIIQVKVTDPSGGHLADLNTQVAARVAETASTTGALFVSVIDDNGDPVSGATVGVANTTVAPNVNVSDSTDSNGIAIFYGLPPDTGNDYAITASKSGYSSLTTIKPSGSLQPNYLSQNIITQSSSYVTLAIKQTGANSLLVETTDTSGNPLGSVKVYVKGGYKKYTAIADTSYCYDNASNGNLTNCTTQTATDTRPTTDPTTGLAVVSNLVPGTYIFCGDAGATNCKIGNTTYYLAAAVPYGGNNSFNPITVPIFDPSNPPTTTYPYGGVNYLQKVRLILASSSSFPRVASMTPDDLSLSGGSATSFAFTVTGTNLPCSASAGSCSTTVKFVQGSTTFTASCTGNLSGVQLSCTDNLSTATAGSAQLVITVGSDTLTLPASLALGGLNVTP